MSMKFECESVTGLVCCSHDGPGNERQVGEGGGKGRVISFTGPVE